MNNGRSKPGRYAADLVSQNAIREAVVGRLDGDDRQWTMAVRLGGPTARLIPLRSRREPLRVWASLTAVAKFAEAVGLRGFVVEL